MRRPVVGAERGYEIAVMAAAVIVVGLELAEWRIEPPDIQIVSITALLLVPLAVRTQITVSRGEPDLTLGISAAALFSVDLAQDSSVLPLWALLVTASYVVFHRDETFGLFRAAIQVLGGWALVEVARLVDLGYRPYDRVLAALAAFLITISALEMTRRLFVRRDHRGEPGSQSVLLHLRWAYVLSVVVGMYFVSAAIAIMRRLEAGVGVPVVPTYTVAFIGAAVVAAAALVQSRELSRSLTAVVSAAVAMPWRRDEIDQYVTNAARSALRTDEVTVERTPGTGFAISAPIDGSFVVARRSVGDRPFTIVDRRVLDALASMATSSRRRAEIEDDLIRRAGTDPLSGLLTYARFRDELDLVSLRRPAGERLGLVFIDLDGFKELNDSVGHFAGDHAIVVVAERLKQLVGERGLVARYGGDEFAIALRDVENEQALREFAFEAVEAIGRPIDVQVESVFLSASAGVALSSSADDDLESLLRVADQRMYAAKRGKSGMDADLRGFDVELYDVIRSAILQQRLTVAYQPLIDVDEGVVIGLEALVRFRHPVLGDIAPTAIVAAARRFGLLDELSMFVATESFHTMTRIRELPGGADLRGFAINLEIDQMHGWTPLLQYLATRTWERQIEVTIEISERSFERWNRSNTAVVERLLDAGVWVVIDDFGTGSAGLASLFLARLHGVKIDRSLVAGLVDPRKALMLDRTLAMLVELGFTVTVEGVEDAHDFDRLRDMGVQHAQGWHFGVPASGDALVERFRSRGFAALPG